MDRPLEEWERQVVERLAAVDGEQREVVLDSLPHLVVTGGCGCGCVSFNLRDSRSSPQPHELLHFANGWTPDKSFGFALFLGPDDRPISVDVEGPPNWKRGDPLPDPASLIVASPYG